MLSVVICFSSFALGYSIRIWGLLHKIYSYDQIIFLAFFVSCVCHSVVSNSLLPLVCPWNSLGKNTGVSCHSLLQGIFQSQGSNQGLCALGRFFIIGATREASCYCDFNLQWFNLRLNCIMEKLLDIFICFLIAKKCSDIASYLLDTSKPLEGEENGVVIKGWYDWMASLT